MGSAHGHNETTTFIAAQIAKWQTGDAFAWAISLKPEPAPIGMIELRPGDGSIGFVLGRACWNRGIMSEALAAVVDHARTALKITTLRAWCDTENRGPHTCLKEWLHRGADRAGPATALRLQCDPARTLLSALARRLTFLRDGSIELLADVVTRRVRPSIAHGCHRCLLDSFEAGWGTY